MKIIESISVSEDATLFSLSDSPADISFIAGIFEKIDAGCVIRMINSSETEISLLFVKADVDATVAAIKKEFE